MIAFKKRILRVKLHIKNKMFCLLFIFSLDEIPKIKICHMVTKEHPEVIEGRRQLIYVDVIDSEEEAEDAAIDYDDAALDEEYGSGLVGEGVTEEVRDIQKALKSSSLSSYMLKPSHLPTHTFGKIGQHRRSYSNTCVILGHKQSGWKGEYLSVLILMLRQPKINAVSSILRHWATSQVI